jgi:hypothetical protein
MILDKDKVAQCIRLGFSDRAIAKELGMSHANWMRRKHQEDIEEVRREVAAAAPLAIFSALWDSAMEGKIGAAREMLHRHEDRFRGACPCCGYRE